MADLAERASCRVAQDVLEENCCRGQRATKGHGETVLVVVCATRLIGRPFGHVVRVRSPVLPQQDRAVWFGAGRPVAAEPGRHGNGNHVAQKRPLWRPLDAGQGAAPLSANDSGRIPGDGVVQ